jgi:6,7-dimethyl-8-ribityllumazine synthase
MSTGGFWPGEQPASEQDDAHEPELLLPGSPERVQPGPEQELEAAPAEAVQAEPEPAVVEEAAQEPALPPEPPVMTEPEAPAALPEHGEAEPEATVVEPPPPLPPASPALTAQAAHAPGELAVPDDVALLEGSPSGADRTVGIVVSRFNGEISDRLLASALDALRAAGLPAERITVMPVPGAFELPIGAMALAKTRRYSCIVALGCVVRGDTAHFEYIASEAASGLQLAGLETGVPVAFGVLTVDTVGQAEARVEKGAEAARAALEMADLFSQLRAQAKA